MRILNVSETYVPFLEFGGPPVKVRALSEGLAQCGHPVNVLTADWGLEKRLRDQSEVELNRTGWDRSPFGWRHMERGVQSIYLPSWLRYRTVSWNPAVNRYCRARLKNFDVVHIFGLYDLLGPSVARLARTLNIPYVVEPIGMFVPIVHNVWLKRMYHAVLGRPLFAGASAIVATSDQEVAELAAAGIARGKIMVRRNGVEPPASWPTAGSFRAEYGIAKSDRVILFLGRLSPKKSPELLLQAFAQLPERIGEGLLTLVFAGPDADGQQQRLSVEASRLRVASRVKFVGPLFGEDKWAAYRDADIFVLPSQNENFGNSAAEAVAAGTPVVVTEQCGIAPRLKDRAGLVVTHDAASLYSAMGAILRDLQLHTRFVGGCAEVTAELGWGQPVKEMETLYGRLIKIVSPGNVSRPTE